MPRNLYALLVGINQYPSPVPILRGCVRDVEYFAQYLEQHRENSRGKAFKLHVKKLCDSQATRQAVIGGFLKHLAKAEKDDVALFYYAGHGSQETADPIFWKLEPDHRNETLVCWDSRHPDGHDLADKELGYLIGQVAAKGAHVVIILDACHSGSGTRDAEATVGERWAPADQRVRPLDSYIFPIAQIDEQPELSTPGVDSSGWLSLPEGRHVLLAACKDSETAKEYVANGEVVGGFSYFLRKVLEETSGPLTYRDLFNQARSQTLNNIVNQNPQLEVTSREDVQQPFLGGAVRPRDPYFSVSFVKPGGWWIDGGTLHGLSAPQAGETTELALFALDVAPPAMLPKNALLTATLTEVLPQKSRLALAKSGLLDPQEGYKAILTRPPLPPMQVVFEGETAGLELARKALSISGPSGGPSLYVQESRGSPKYRLLAREGAFAITLPADNRPVSECIQGYDSASAELAIFRLEHIARWHQTAELSHPGGRLPSDALKVSLVLNGEETAETSVLAEYRYSEGKWRQPQYTLKIENYWREALYVSVLGLWESFGIDASFFPAGGDWVQPRRGSTPGVLYTNLMYGSVPKDLWETGITERRDLLKVIACSAAFDPTLLEQSALPSFVDRGLEGSRPSPPKGALNRLLSRVQTREGSDRPEEDEYDDWITTQVQVTVRRPRLETPLAHEGEAIPLGAGVTIEPHPALVANARLSSAPQASRDVLNRPLPPILESASQPLYFNPSRGADPGLSVLELSEVGESYRTVSPEAPLRVNLPVGLENGEQVLPVAFDGEFYLPLGYARQVLHGTQVVLERLAAPVAQGERDLKGAVRIFFQKVISKPLGLDYPYPILAAAQVDPNGTVHYEAEPAKVRALVQAANRITLYVHGFTGDTRGMLGNAAGYIPGDLLMGFDYESVNTSVEEIARGLKGRLQAIGLAPGHAKELRLVAHSLGGLVARWFIEHEGGKDMVSQLVILGSPNNGTPWPSVQQWATVAIGVALNSLSAAAWPLKVLGLLLNAFEKVDVTLDQIQPGSELLKTLEASPDPHIPYTLIAGNTAVLLDALAGGEKSRMAGLMKRLLYGFFDLGFFGKPNDFVVSVESVHHVDASRTPPPQPVAIPCDHVTYFSSEFGLDSLRDVLA